MKSDIADVIANLVLEAAPDLASRLEYQAEALREVKCIDLTVGRWIDRNDVKHLISTFALNDKDFAAKFPKMAHITAHERQRLLATIEGHLELCPHCALKRSYDLELDSKIKQACQQNNHALLQLLEEDEADQSEGEHQNAELEQVI